MKIKQVCEITGISKRNIHFYINEKLITPSIHPDNNYYEFSDQDCQKLLFIKEMRNAGLPLNAIHSIITTPATARYYLNRHIQQLKKERRHLEQVIVSMDYILDELPLFSEFSSLYNLCIDAKIPSKEKEIEQDSTLDNNNVMFINQFIWGAFIPKSKFTDYQEFLWMKLNKLTFENPSQDYLLITQFLNSLPSNQIDQMISFQTTRYEYIASLDKKGIEECIKDTIQRIKESLDNPLSCFIWKNFYDEYFYPITSIQASNLSDLVQEMSPFFKDYVRNIHTVCEEVYSYLHTEQGQPLLNRLQKEFMGKLNLDKNYHGEIEALACINEVQSLY